MIVRSLVILGAVELGSFSKRAPASLRPSSRRLATDQDIPASTPGKPTMADLRANAANGSLGPLLIDVKQAYFGSKGGELQFAACGACGSYAQGANRRED